MFNTLDAANRNEQHAILSIISGNSITPLSAQPCRSLAILDESSATRKLARNRVRGDEIASKLQRNLVSSKRTSGSLWH